MDIFKQIEEKESENDKIYELLNRILDSLDKITEFNDRELKAISILETDPFFKEYLDFFIQNKKHIKRKHSKEILQALANIASTLRQNNDTNKKFEFGV